MVSGTLAGGEGRRMLHDEDKAVHRPSDVDLSGPLASDGRSPHRKMEGGS